jgi:uncharacterized protein (UPF0276 family)
MGFRGRHKIPDLGVGVGFRVPHYAKVLEEQPPMDWFEVISENFMVQGGRPLANLDALRSKYRVVPHGVSLSIGGSAPLDQDYLKRLRALYERLSPPWASDHLCWGGTASLNAHELLPLPMNREVVAHVVERVKRVQDAVRVPFALENVSSYMTFNASTMHEFEFVAEVAEKSDSGILFDVNNVYVSYRNHGTDPDAYVKAMPKDRVVQIHVAGHTEKEKYVLDTHAGHVRDEVWDIYRHAIARLGAVSTLVEWDDEIPEWEVLSTEADKARTIRAAVLASATPEKEGARAWPLPA